MMRMTDQLVRIASAGGGMKLSMQGMMTDQLVRIAAAAAKGGGQIILVYVGSTMTDQLVRIANAGQGRVIFDFTS